MGAVCYKAKPTSISKDDVLRALNDKYLKEMITEPDSFKTHKTEEQQQYLLTFGTLTQQIMNETQEAYIHTSPKNGKKRKTQYRNQNTYNAAFGQIELNILTYYGHKEDIYNTLTMMSRKSLYFMKKNYKKIEQFTEVKHANEKIRLVQLKSLEEHSSGVNQLLKIGPKEMVTVSDDCYLKFWSTQTLKVECSVASETVTCIVQTGYKVKDILVAGCHSGNLILISTSQRLKKDQVTSAHYNLIRVIVSLESLKHKYFVTADVCGILKMWTSSFKPQEILSLDLEQAISYNSMIEVMDILPKRFEENALIACALKSQKVNLIMLIPSSGTYQILKTLKTNQKPTCLIQLSSKHLAIAVGSLREQSDIEIHDINKNTIISILKHHNDMIDSLLKIKLPSSKTKIKNPYVQWLLSASRDRQIVLWKLIDGKVMKRQQASLINSQKKQSLVSVQQIPSHLPSRSSVIEESKNRSSKSHKKEKKQRKRRNNSDEDDDMISEEHDQEEDEQEKSEDSEEEKEQENNEQQQNKIDAVVEPHQKMLDYYFVLDSGHKDFIRSMVQINDNSIITASEDKTIKIFSINYS